MICYFMHALAKRQRARNSFNVLSSLNDDQLKDIGLTREGIRRFEVNGMVAPRRS